MDPEKGKTNAPPTNQEKQEDIYDRLDLDKKFPDFKGWEMIGFHRQLGSEFWNILLQLANTALSIVLMSYLAPLIAPYPEIGGYGSIAGGLFSIVFTIFDVPTNFGIGNFIAQYRVSNPEKMMEYIRFFIWWQMLSGLIQVTGLTIFTFNIIIYGQYAYLTWLLLLILQQQWPSMLGIYRSCIDGFQHFDKSNILNFLSGTVVGQLLNVAIVLFGRWYGYVHPELGEILGMAIAGSIGGYINSILFFFISAYYFNRIIKKMGFMAKDAWQFKFGKDVVKRSLNYGIQSSVVPVVAGVTGLLFLVWKTSYIAGYVTWSALIGHGYSMTTSIGTFGSFSISTPLAEAYPNGKEKLTEFYISYSMKWRMLFMSMMGTVLIGLFPYFSIIYNGVSGLKYWAPALVFYYPGLVRRWFDPFFNLADGILQGTFKIRQWTIARICEESMKVVNLYIFLLVLQVQDTWGVAGIVFLLMFDQIIPTTIKTLACLVYFHKRVAKIKIYWMSSFIIPSLAATPAILLAYFWLDIVFMPLMSAVGLIAAAVISIIIAFGLLFFVVYFPLLGILGGFDDYMLFVFKKAVDLSGPSKFAMKFVLKMAERGCNVGRKLKLHGRFGIPWEDAHKEIEELMVLKQSGKMTFLEK